MKSESIATIFEAAAVDLCLDPRFRVGDWTTQRAVAEHIAEHSRADINIAYAMDLFADLRRKQFVRRSRRRGEYEHETTPLGERALAAWAGFDRERLSNALISLSQTIVHDIEKRAIAPFAEAFDPRAQPSELPFRAPRGKTAAERCAALFNEWISGERPWMLLAFLQERLEPVRWIDRADDRRTVIFEVNKALSYARLAVTWERGLIVLASEALHESLAVRRALEGHPAQAVCTTPAPTTPLPAEIPWDADEGAFTRDFVIPLARALGLQSVRYRGGASEYGKDVVGKYQDPLGRDRWVAIQVKMDLPGSAASGAIRSLQQQIDEAFALAFEDTATRARLFVHEVWVIVAASLTAKVQQIIVEGIDEPARKANVRFVDRENLVECHASRRKL